MPSSQFSVVELAFYLPELDQLRFRQDTTRR